MAKLFQTRLKIEDQSPNITPFNPKIEQGSTTPHANTFKLNQGEGLISKIQIGPNQGESTISKPPPIRFDTSRQISVDVEKSKADYLILRQSNLLKYNLPAVSPSLSQVAGTPNKLFSDRVNLENRIKQTPLTGTTIGLPQFFLSDFYANRLPDIQYSFTPNQGGIIIQSLLYTPTQGSITINNINFAPIQGSIIINPFSFTPNQGNINIIPFIFESLPHQGTTTLNGITTSVIGVFPFNFLPNQGETTIGLYNPTINQDAFTVLGSIMTIGQVQLNQGLTFDLTGGLVSFLLPNYTLSNPTQGSSDPTLINFDPTQGSADPTLINFNPTQGSSDPTLINFDPEQGTVKLNVASIVNINLLSRTKPKEFHGEASLNILQYELDRVLAKTLPEVKHGSSEKYDFLNQAVNQGIGPFSANNPPPDDEEATYSLASTYGAVIDTPDRDPLPLPVDTFVKKGDISRIYYDLTNNSGVPASFADLDNYLAVANTYKGVLNPKYSEWKTRATNAPAAPTMNVAQENELKAKQNNTAESLRTQASSRKAKDENSDTANDYVALSFTSIRDGNTIAFKSYITSLSDNWSPTHTDVKYVGRQDTFKVFNGVTRNISLGFKIPSDSDASHRLMYNKLQNLIRAAVIGDYQNGKPYIVGPMMKITIGNYVRNTPCIVTSLKIDTNPSEYPWEISTGRELPQFLDVSMDFFILGDNNGNTLKKSGTFISIAS